MTDATNSIPLARYEQERAEDEATIRGYLDAMTAAQESEARMIEERDALAQRVKELEAALKGLSDLYSHAWDRIEGGLVMFGPSVERFEQAHSAARIALRCPLYGDRGEYKDDAAMQQAGKAEGGV